MNICRYFLAILALAFLQPASTDAAEAKPAAHIERLRMDMSRPGRYARSFRDPAGTIHLLGCFQITADAAVKYVGDSGPDWGANLSEAEINTFHCRTGLFLGLRNRVTRRPDGSYAGTAWRSTDNLATIRKEEIRLILPEAGDVDYGSGELWAGLFFHRGVIELADGSLLAAMYGNFEQDTLRPTHPWSKTETLYKLRAFAVRSTDNGKSWRYLSCLAAPDPAVPDDSEGFNEWTVTRLEDGRLLAVIRTGHFTPMVACWSGDEGRSWTKPRSMRELGPAGVDPHLIRLRDGRPALAYGEMVQPPPGRNMAASERDTRRRCRLAIGRDKAGERWDVIDVSGYDNRSAYPTIFQLKDGAILYQADLEIWKIAPPD